MVSASLTSSPTLREIGWLSHPGKKGGGKASSLYIFLHCVVNRDSSFLYTVSHTMIDPGDRLWAGSGALLTGGPYTWQFTDFDERKTFSVTTYANPFPVEDVEGTEEICLAKLQKHIDQLGDGVFGLRFLDPDGPV
ncbi:hypothetical protein MYCTH_2299066 [Thermothelomyces thermophilus ATCC 42464]|uniref:Uncharacterized protein n=1 Tax=Thermothelomyces thermophilus (strain ATCC 42464 / BCRC 31852 / DSM 1799) TaxID=573729 RepID=G2Q4E6_THET4|nr:uncharacterized protein MYCTH_2299066 [Thermothelomyces thermophilus ATCC 42464]AEO55341.1 hypothetical protein MYCTH_2299066 [Thermothelomyces thermophilus ATCC 42464]